MSKIHVTRKHTLGRDIARAEVERIAERVEEEFGADWEWDGDTLDFSRAGVHGHITVTDKTIKLTVKLGLLLAPMKQHLKEKLVGKIDRALARAHQRHGATD
jgi:putative polyhydroxyalkanoate system protein